MTTRHVRSLEVGDVTGDGRTIPIRLFRWDHPERVTDDGRTFYREQFARSHGIGVPDEQLLVRNEHTGAVVGRIADVEPRDDGPWAYVRVADTTDGRDVLALNDEGILGASIEFDDDPRRPRPGELVTRSNAVLAGLAFTVDPQYTSTRVLARRSRPQEPSMSDTSDDTTRDDDVDQTDDDTTPTDDTTTSTDQHQRSNPAPRSAAGVRRVNRAQAAQQPRPSTRFRSLGEFVHASALGTIPVEERQRYYRALSAAATSDAPGLVHDVWIGEVLDLMRTRTPSLSLFATRPLPEEGLTINQPIVLQRPLVGVQPGELEQIPSRKVKIGNVSWDVATYGGGQEMSVQVMRRTSPSYLNEVYRLYVQAMSLDLEADVAAAILAASTVTNTAAIDVGDTDKNYIDAFIDAAAVLLGQPTIGAMPEAVGLSIAMWKKLAKAKDDVGRPLFMGLSPFNMVGRMSLTDPDGQIIDLNYAVIPAWGTSVKVAVLGVREAFRTMVSAPSTMQADVPETLSHDYAVYEFAAFGAADTAGLVKVEDPD